MERYFLNLCEGLRRIEVPFRTNAFRHANSHRHEIVGIVGKGHLLRRYVWRNPIIFGPAVFSHPIDDLIVFKELPIRMVLVSCDWMKKMYQDHIRLPVVVWAAGIDTYKWVPGSQTGRTIDVLVYDKIRWERHKYEPELLAPIISHLDQSGLRYQIIRYGFYLEEEYQQLLRECRCMIFLVEHETQGFAYLQALSSGVPIFAWDRGGPWKDPAYYPHRVRFEPVTSVPYWDDRCGKRFRDVSDFTPKWEEFWSDVSAKKFRPRDYVLENLSLEKCARQYVELTRL